MNPLRDRILDTLLELAESQPYDRVRRADIADKLGIAQSQINHLFGGVAQMHDAMMLRAVSDGNLRVIASGLERGHPTAKAASEELKARALQTLI